MDSKEMVKKWREMNADVHFGVDYGVRSIRVRHQTFSGTQSIEELTTMAYEWFRMNCIEVERRKTPAFTGAKERNEET